MTDVTNEHARLNDLPGFDRWTKQVFETVMFPRTGRFAPTWSMRRGWSVMGIRDYAAVIRRQRWLIVGTIVAVLGSTVLFYRLRQPSYRATATVALRSSTPEERLFDPPRSEEEPNIAAEAAFAASFGVVSQAASKLPGVSTEEILDHLSVDVDAEREIVQIQATNSRPDRARDIASSVAKAFVEDRQQAAVQDVKNLSDGLGKTLAELQKEIADLDARIGDGGLKSPPGLLNPATAGAPGSPEAARYSAAVRYQQVFERQQQLLIEQSLRSGGAVLIADATVPRVPVGPGFVQSAGIGAFVGLLLGAALAILRDHLDDRLRSQDDLHGPETPVVLAELPWTGDGALRGVEVVSRPNGPFAEASRGLRTTLQQIDRQAPLRRLVITSPGRGEGKSFVAANLAAVFASAGYRTMLVSSDLRRPGLEMMLGVDGRTKVGLSTFVASDRLRPAATTRLSQGGSSAVGVATGDDPITTADRLRPLSWDGVSADVRSGFMATRVANLTFLPAGSLPSNPAELLGSQDMTQVLNTISAVADVVILDAPPVLEVTDASVMAGAADGVLLVARVGRTTGETVRQAQVALERADARLVGVVLNGVRPRRGLVKRRRGVRSSWTDGQIAAQADRHRPHDRRSGEKQPKRQASFQEQL